MIRRHIASALIVFFFSYAAYLILTDGGKSGSTITFSKLNDNIQKKFMILTGQQEPELTPEELAKENELKEAEERERLAIEKATLDKLAAEAALKAMADNKDASDAGRKDNKSGSNDGTKK